MAPITKEETPGPMGPSMLTCATGAATAPPVMEKVGVAKTQFSLLSTVMLGLLAGRSVFDKAVAIVFPISAFVATGFEHSIANMYLIPMGMLRKASGHVAANVEAISWAGYFGNLVPVILGNLVGGSVLVGFVYYVIYLRFKPD
ncbi:MAG: hypothetical protein COB49_07880 [Alphaproteobacteria bacterium]|nr:MAG: hypothetical protein COB49_07880 [Alphaproteobacteria bacterium]